MLRESDIRHDSTAKRSESPFEGPSTLSTSEGRKRKRNKPTLACKACVDRKTRCDRTRPSCLACKGRATECQYLEQRPVLSQDLSAKFPPHGKKQTTDNLVTGGTIARLRRTSRSTSPTALVRRQTSIDTQPLLSDLPYPTFSAINLYGLGSEHPFKNYWTFSGGLGEVIQVLPSKYQCDILLARFFDSIDPIFPLFHRQNFQRRYEDFWHLPDANKAEVETSFVALLFVMLALGTQFLRLPDEHGAAEPIVGHGAEFYASACHQALHLGAYLNRTSVSTLQTMLYMTYFLSNANRASDGWAFAGILIRQAYASALNRNPSMLSRPKETLLEQHERRRMWHAIVAQDASMSVVLKLPPGAIHADLDEASPLPRITSDSGSSDTGNDPALLPSTFELQTDIDYTHGMYTMALLVQQTIATPRSISLRLANTPKQRAQLLARFDACHQRWSETLRIWDENTLSHLVTRDVAGRRLVRQIFFLTSHYWHYVMLIHIDGCELATESKSQQAEVVENVKGALEAAHHVMQAFFVLPILLEGEAGTRWTKAHRAFSAALTMVDLLKKHDPALASTTHTEPSTDPINSHWRRTHIVHDETMTAAFAQAKVDVRRCIDILKSLPDYREASNSHVEMLESIYGPDVADQRRSLLDARQ